MAKGAAGSLLAMVGLNVAGKAIKNVLDNYLVLTMSDDELKSKRKELQKQYRYAQGDEADRLYSDMKAIDSELQRRALGEEKPRGPGYHREHGYNLMKDD